MIDSVTLFLERFQITNKDFINFGLENIHWCEPEDAYSNWLQLKKRIQKGEDVFVRQYGRVEEKHNVWVDFYDEIFGINVGWDKTNNWAPAKNFVEATGKKKNRDLKNFKISHVWEKCKNPFAFCAAWNMAYTPIVIDPFTGHEAKGTVVTDFQKLFKHQAYEKFEKSILDYNKLMKGYQPKINRFIKKFESSNQFTLKVRSEIVESIKENFSTIQ